VTRPQPSIYNGPDPGYTVSGTFDPAGRIIQAVQLADTVNLDAFSRLRVSEPNYVFDTNFQYDLQPLIFEQVTAESGATVAHESTNRSALMTFANTPTGGKAYMQTYEWFRYQSGRSQLVFVTFNFIEPKANVLKFAGLSDGNNGIEFQLNGETKQFTLYSDTAKGDETVAQADWNLDRLDGTGPSGITLDVTKTHIVVIDFQWLGVGRVRVGFDIGGAVLYAHEFVHANVQTVAYMQTANLPVRVGMTSTGTVSTTMRFVCASVSSEGGESDVGGFSFSVEGTATAANGARTHILSMRPKTTFNSITNRTKFILENIDVLVTGNTPVLWELCIGDVLTGTTTFADVNTTYSGMQYNTAGTTSGTPAVVLLGGYAASTATSKSVVSRSVGAKSPITLNAAGAVRSLGTMSLLVTGLGGTAAVRADMDWRELR